MKKVLFLFGELTDLDVDWLSAQGRTQPMTKGAVLIEEGKPTRALYIVLDGQFEVLVGRTEMRPIARVGTGEILGEISFVDSRAPIGTVRALTDSLVFAMPSEVLTAKFKQDPAFASRFYRALAMFLSHRLRAMTLKFSAAQSGADSTETEAPGELNDEVLSGVYLGGKRFQRMLKQLTLS
jgi:CRP-like cAMP-binding protein